MAYYDKLLAEVPPSLVELLRIPGSVPRRSASSTASSASRRSTTSARPPRRARSATLQGSERPDRAADPRGHRASRDDAAADAAPSRRGDDRRVHRSPYRHARRQHHRAGRLVPPKARERSATSTCSPRPTTDPGSSSASPVSASSTRSSTRAAYKAAVRAAARPAGRPDGDAARRRGHVPHPFHGLEGAQRPAPRAGPRHGLEPVREGLPADRRGRRAADRRTTPSSDLPDRGRGIRVPRAAVHRTRAARGRGRDRGSPRGPPAAP